MGGKVKARLSRKGWQGAARDGGRGSTVQHHPLPGDEGTPAQFLLWDPYRLPKYYAWGGHITRKKWQPSGGTPVSRLLNVLEGVVGWKRPEHERPCCVPHSLTAQSASVGRRCWGPLPVYWEAVFANIVCFQFQEELWENLWIKPNAKCWTLFPFPFLSDCFNCSVVVLMDLRPWSGSCLSDFQLLFVNNLKRKKKETLHFGDKPVWVFYWYKRCI